jgi:hypothetical protein
VPDGQAEINIVDRQGGRSALELNKDDVMGYLEKAALPAARQLDIPHGVDAARSATYDKDAGKKLLKNKPQD